MNLKKKFIDFRDFFSTQKKKTKIGLEKSDWKFTDRLDWHNDEKQVEENWWHLHSPSKGRK